MFCPSSSGAVSHADGRSEECMRANASRDERNMRCPSPRVPRTPGGCRVVCTRLSGRTVCSHVPCCSTSSKHRPLIHLPLVVSCLYLTPTHILSDIKTQAPRLTAHTARTASPLQANESSSLGLHASSHSSSSSQSS